MELSPFGALLKKKSCFDLRLLALHKAQTAYVPGLPRGTSKRDALYILQEELRDSNRCARNQTSLPLWRPHSSTSSLSCYERGPFRIAAESVRCLHHMTTLFFNVRRLWFQTSIMR